jgi:hypothetical protein
MRTQKHNEGELKKLTVEIEKEIVESVEEMSKNSHLSVEEIVVIALKRFRASHNDYRGKSPSLDK